jgi:hypothetical protein
LIGKVVLLKVTETHKWHISGHILNANPKIPHVDSEKYFADCAAKRAQAAQASQDPSSTGGPSVEYKLIEDKVLLKATTEQFALHLIGMLLLALGVYAALKGILGGSSEDSVGSSLSSLGIQENVLLR